MVAASTEQVSLLRSREEFLQIRDEWLGLWSETGAGIYCHWDWLASVIDSYGRDISHCHVTIRRDGRLTTVFPASLHGDVLTSAGTPRADCTELMSLDPDPAQAAMICLKTLFTELPDWGSACFDLVPADSPLLQAVLASDATSQTDRTGQRPAPGRPLATVRAIAPWKSLAGDTEELVRQVAWKKTPRRRRNQLQKLGRLRFEQLTDTDQMHEVLPRFVEMHQSRRETLGDESYLTDPRGTDFMRSLIDRLGPQHLIVWHTLSLDDCVIACCCGFEAHGRYYYYTPAFDSQWGQYGPGSVLLSGILEDCIRRGVQVFDFGQGDEDYKHRYADGSENLYALHLFRNGFCPTLNRLQLVLKEKLRRHPVLFAQLKRFAGQASVL